MKQASNSNARDYNKKNQFTAQATQTARICLVLALYAFVLPQGPLILRRQLYEMAEIASKISLTRWWSACSNGPHRYCDRMKRLGFVPMGQEQTQD